jgi:hypothetical protein
VLLENAQDASASVEQLVSTARFQPYPDSTGGSSMTNVARARDPSMDAQRNQRVRPMHTLASENMARQLR